MARIHCEKHFQVYLCIVLFQNKFFPTTLIIRGVIISQDTLLQLMFPILPMTVSLQQKPCLSCKGEVTSAVSLLLWPCPSCHSHIPQPYPPATFPSHVATLPWGPCCHGGPAATATSLLPCGLFQHRITTESIRHALETLCPAAH